MNVTIRVVIILSLMAASLFAGEETSKHHLIGLSEPDRVNDLREIVNTMPGVELVSVDYETNEVSFKYDVSKLINGYNPKKPLVPEAITKRIDELLKNAARGTFSLKPLSTLPKEQLKIEEFPVGLLDCKGCRYGAYIAVAKVDGVERVTVSSEKSILKAWFDPAKTNRTALETALKNAKIDRPEK